MTCLAVMVDVVNRGDYPGGRALDAAYALHVPCPIQLADSGTDHCLAVDTPEHGIVSGTAHLDIDCAAIGRHDIAGDILFCIIIESRGVLNEQIAISGGDETAMFVAVKAHGQFSSVGQCFSYRIGSGRYGGHIYRRHGHNA